ncbi:hypothetical protein R3P38DRAFT_3497530, partial [Favolaschia claudopus]
MDSKSFSTYRLRSGHGYGDKPAYMHLGFSHRLEGMKLFKARVVELGDKRWMLWSPNSSQDPFYPGGAEPLVSGFTAAELEQRRCDGHCGRFDAGQNPQPYAKELPWLGFIKRDGEIVRGIAEHHSILSVWVDAEEGGKVDDIHVSDLQLRNQELESLIEHFLPQLQGPHSSLRSRRPIGPRQQDLDRLKEIRSFEEALDVLAGIHRGIKEEQAWYTLARLRVESSTERVNSSKFEATPPADDAYLGAWVNGVERATVEWLLHVARLPCFIISEVPSGVIVGRTFPSFVESTEAERLCDPRNEFDQVATNAKSGFTANEIPAYPMDAPSFHVLERVRSSVYWQAELPLICEVPFLKAGLCSVERILAGVRPPKIAAKADAKGSWSVFREVDSEWDEPDVGPMMRLEGTKKRGKADTEGDEEVWYDRHLKRKLIISSLPPLPSVLRNMDSQFGRPAPTWPFGARSNEKWVMHSPSLWMYPTEEP